MPSSRSSTISPLVALLAAALLAGCAEEVPPPRTSANPPAAAAPAGYPEKFADAWLSNAGLLHERVISGAQPDDAAFAALRELGVVTIISVDGAKPFLELARRYCMRCVYLSHGYDRISASRAA